MHLVCEAKQPAQTIESLKMSGFEIQAPFNENIADDPPPLYDREEYTLTENEDSMKNIKTNKTPTGSFNESMIDDAPKLEDKEENENTENLMESNGSDPNNIEEPVSNQKTDDNLEQHGNLENNTSDLSTISRDSDAVNYCNGEKDLQSADDKLFINVSEVSENSHNDGFIIDDISINIDQGPKEDNHNTEKAHKDTESEEIGCQISCDIESSEDNDNKEDEGIPDDILSTGTELHNSDDPNNDENIEILGCIDTELNSNQECDEVPKNISNDELKNHEPMAKMVDVIDKNDTEERKVNVTEEMNELQEDNINLNMTKDQDKGLIDDIEPEKKSNDDTDRNNVIANKDNNLSDVDLEADILNPDISTHKENLELYKPEETNSQADEPNQGFKTANTEVEKTLEKLNKSINVKKDLQEDRYTEDQTDCDVNTKSNTDELVTVKESEISYTSTDSVDVDIGKSNDDTAHDNIINVANAEQAEAGEEVESKDTAEKETPQIENKSLSNNLDILSDDEESQTPLLTKISNDSQQKKDNDKSNPDIPYKDCVTLDDDDDIMVVDDKSDSTEKMHEKSPKPTINPVSIDKEISPTDVDIPISTTLEAKEAQIQPNETVKKHQVAAKIVTTLSQIDEKPLVAVKFMESLKTKLGDMTRTDLEEFCLLKIVEGVVDRSNLSEIKGKVKSLTQTVEEWRKKAMVLNKQHRDLQIVLRTVQEEQKKKSGEVITPLRITRSVGMQVVMTETKAADAQRSRPAKRNIANTNKNTPQKNATQNNQKCVSKPAVIPVPRLVPLGANTPTKSPRSSHMNLIPTAAPTVPTNTGPSKANTHPTRAVLTQPKPAEKRPLSSVSIDLTDDEPPSKQMVTGKAVQPPVRLVPAQQLMAQNRAPLVNHGNQNSNPRQVYIPISGNQTKIRPGQSIMFKTMTTNARPRQPGILRSSAPVIRPGTLARGNQARHPAPLPHASMQSASPNWKSLPPAPDLKIAKVENGIVISWKMDGYKEESFEEIASYQLFAYQETSSPPNTMLWKKIGDVKALPLPMACTLTQFMAGYKYYFAVRAVDVRSRIGPFSLPGSILLLNK